MIFYHYNSFLQKEALEESTHNILLKRFQYYLLIGGLPEAINNYLADRNMVRVRQTHRDIHNLYRIDASQYDEEHKLSPLEKVINIIFIFLFGIFCLVSNFKYGLND